MEKKEVRKPTLFEALLPVFCLIVMLGGTILILKGSSHIPLIMGTGIAAIMGVRLGYTWSDLEDGLVNGIMIAMKAILILMIIGILIGTWIVGGIVPAMIYYGLKIISPSIFLVTTCIICAVVSISTGSSWSTAGTVGLALIGIGKTMGMPVPLVAGAIISGAYFGDKMSPLSDTTNLAPATAGTDLFTHIRHMVYTTAPSLTIALILYAIIGIKFAGASMNTENVDEMLITISNNFNINLFLLIPPCLVLFMVVFKIPALPALLGGGILGGMVAIIFQGTSLAEAVNVAFQGYVSHTGVPKIDELLTRGGLLSMMETVALIMCALSFGGVMEKTGMLERIAAAMLRFAVSTGSLVLITIFTCIFMNIMAPDQYLSIVIPGRMYRNAFFKRGLHPKNLSRCLEDSGTLSSPLIPWNTCGAFMHATLGVNPLAYLPFAFLNLLNPCVSIFYGFTGITMHKLEEGECEVIRDDVKE